MPTEHNTPSDAVDKKDEPNKEDAKEIEPTTAVSDGEGIKEPEPADTDASTAATENNDWSQQAQTQPQEPKKCDTYDELMRNAGDLSESLNDCLALPAWIDGEVLTNLKNSIAEKPNELEHLFSNLLDTLENYKKKMDDIRTNVNMLILFVVQAINSDNQIKEVLLGSVGNRTNEAVADDDKYCDLVKEGQECVDQFTVDIIVSADNFKTTIAPEMETIVSLTEQITPKYTSEMSGAEEFEEAHNDIQTLTQLIQAQIQYCDKVLKESVDKFQVSSEDAAATCESGLGVILEKMKEIPTEK